MCVCMRACVRACVPGEMVKHVVVGGGRQTAVHV